MLTSKKYYNFLKSYKLSIFQYSFSKDTISIEIDDRLKYLYRDLQCLNTNEMGLWDINPNNNILMISDDGAIQFESAEIGKSIYNYLKSLFESSNNVLHSEDEISRNILFKFETEEDYLLHLARILDILNQDSLWKTN